MIYFIIFLILAVLGFAIWWFFFRDNTSPSDTVEIGGDEICAVINLKHKNENDYLVVGKHYSILLFKNDQCIFSTDDYKVSMKEILSYIEQTDVSKTNKQSQGLNENKMEDIYTCYKIRKNEIKGLEFSYRSNTQLMDVYFGVLLKMRLSIRASFRIIDKPLFIKDFAVFNGKLPLPLFQLTLKNMIFSKLYGSMTSYMHKNQASYLHISLHKFDIENQVLLDLNRYLAIYGIEITKFSFQEITNVEDKYFKWLSEIIVETSKMNLLEYSYAEKRDYENGIHDDLKKDKEFSEAKIYIK